MTPSEYQRLAMRTFKGRHLSTAAQAEYHALKIIEETREVCYAHGDNVVDEIGDLLWHMAGLCEALGIEFDSILPYMPSTHPMLFTSIIVKAIKIGSIVAKHYGQGKPLDLIAITLLLTEILREMRALTDLGWPDIMARNIAKLEARHPDMV